MVMFGLSLRTCLPHLESIALGFSITLSTGLTDRSAVHRHTSHENTLSHIHLAQIIIYYNC